MTDQVNKARFHAQCPRKRLTRDHEEESHPGHLRGTTLFGIELAFLKWTIVKLTLNEVYKVSTII